MSDRRPMAQRRTLYERISQRNTGKTCSCPCATTNNCRMDGFSRISWISVAEKQPGPPETPQTSPWLAIQWRRGRNTNVYRSPIPCGFSTLVWQQHGQAPYQRARRSSMPTPQDVIASLYRAFNTRNFDAYAQFLTPDFQLRAKGGVSVRGVEACQTF